MNLSSLAKKLTVFGVSAFMMIGSVNPVNYQVNAEEPGEAVAWEQIDSSDFKGAEPANKVEEELTEANLIKDGNVRVSIVVDGTSTIEAGYSAQAVATDANAQSYRAQVLNNQKALASKISSEALNGEALDVVWNITFAGNIISAYVPYAKIEMIKRVDGVKDVVIETQYEAPVSEATSDDPDMAVATDMTGTSLIYSDYTGAGQAVAVIDTGLDIDHQSFNPEAFEYSIENLGKEVDLITVDDVAAVLSQTNAYARNSTLTAADVYRSAKVPFAYNYIDNDLNVIHVNDTQGEHGSHVSGIAAGNKYVPDGNGGFAPALDAVKTQGQAPDAQLLVMKVFGRGGGAYDSDYFAAIEDAMVLGAASANLSLGSGNAGMTTSATYADILNRFAEEDTVVTMSAGNSYAWASYSNYGYLYSEDANFATGGSPGSFTNSFTVASVDNDGIIGMPLKVGDTGIFYSEGSSAGNLPMTTIAGEHGYIAIDGVGTDEEMAALKDVLEGKIAVVSRGSTSFYQKANAAVANGAIATIVYNNQPGTINMNLTGYEYTAPAVSITQADGAALKALGEAKTTEGGAAYYEGTMTVTGDYEVSKANADYLTMSSFSSWGATGDLNLKPEITAPGGNIFSVYGTNRTSTGAITGGTDQYELMSGTSMAAPQISGLDAVFHQYIEENDLVEKTGLTERQLTLSLLMSTAKPVLEADTDYYYSLLKQGAGLVNVAEATSAKSYILVDGTTVGGKAVEKAAYTNSYADGKVKAMFGEDADRTGKYTVTFEVTNFSDEEAAFTFDADIFTQDVFPYGPMEFLDEWTLPLDAIVNFTVEGKEPENEEAEGLDFNGDGVFNAYDAQALLDYVTGVRTEINNEKNADIDADEDVDTYDAYLALMKYRDTQVIADAGETLKVTAEIDLNGSLDELGNEDRNGAWVEGYLFVTEADTDEGVKGVEHSIPVLGYFGSWSEPDMHDKGSYLEYAYGEETRAPYMYAALGQNSANVESFGINYAGINGTYYFGGNPYGTDETYHPERNAINSRDTIANAMYSQIRNAGAAIFLVTDKDGEVLAEKDFGSSYAAYYYVNGGEWRGTTTNTALGYQPKDQAEGTELTFTYAMLPEYYVENGEVNWDGYKGNSMSISATVDNTAPEFVGEEPIAIVKDEAGTATALEFTAKDNRYIAAIYLCDEEENVVDRIYADEEAEEGAEKTYTFDLGEDVSDHLYIQMCDYAANETIYKINLNEEELEGDLAVTITPEEINVLKNSTAKATATVSPWGADDRVIWSTADESIATVDADGIVTGVAVGTTTITATSAVDETVSATAAVVVKTFDIELNGIVWDENGEVWFSEFNTNSLPDYTKLSDSMRLPIASAAYDQNGTLYAASFDSDEMVSSLYTIDEETYTATEIGASEIGYMDICKAPSLGDNILLGVYGTYVVIIDAATGDYIGAFNLSSFTGGANLVGIAYEEQYMHSTYGATDWVFLIDEAGVLYNTGFLPYDGGYSRFGVSAIGQIADSVDTPYFQSLYYDGTNLFYSRFNNADNNVELVMIEDLYNVGNIWSVGYFADGVWPVGGLYEKGVYDIGMPEEDPGKAAAVIEASASMDVVRMTPARKLSKGSLNVAIDADKPEDIRKSDEINGAGSADSTLVTVTTDTEATNGLYTVTYDPETVEYFGAKGAVRYSSINDSEEGKIVVGFINPEALDAESVVANISFMAKDASAKNAVEVKTEEENNEKSDNSAETIVGDLTVTAEGTLKVRLTGDDWGAGIDKAIIKLDQAVDGAYITGDLFEVTQSVNNGEATARTVLDAYTSDESGNKISGESEYVTIDMRISPVEGNPIVWSMQTWTNSWADPYVLNINLKEGAKLFAAEDTISAIKVDGTVDVKTVDNENVLIPQLEGYEYSTFEASDGLVIPYGLYTPANADDGNKHALIIWNHGVGERGSDPRIAILGNEVTALNGEEFQALFDGTYVLVPQTPANTAGKDIVTGKIELTEAMIADETLAVDPNRVIVGGCSMGGGQTMNMVYARADLFAAAYPICPASTSAQVTDEQIANLADLPIWFTHCVNDDTVNYEGTTAALIERIKAAGNDNVHVSTFEDVHDTTGRFNDLTEDGSDYQYSTHWSWVYFDNNECFCDECGENEWVWLAEQSKQDKYPDGVVVTENPDTESKSGSIATFTFKANRDYDKVTVFGGFQFFTAEEGDKYLAGETEGLSAKDAFEAAEAEEVMYPYGYSPVDTPAQFEYEMEEVMDGVWQTSLPLPADQYFYAFNVYEGETATKVEDPGNPYTLNPINGNNSGWCVFYAGEAEDALENMELTFPREDEKVGTYEYVPYTNVNGLETSVVVYLPYGYDKANTYKTLYISHGGGGNEMDWPTVGAVKNIFDNAIAEGYVEPTIVVSMNNTEFGWNYEQIQANLEEVLFPMMEEKYNASAEASDRAFSGLSMGGLTTTYLYQHAADKFGYFGIWSATQVFEVKDVPNFDKPVVMLGAGDMDFGNGAYPGLIEKAAEAGLNWADDMYYVHDGHNWYAWPQLLSIFAKDYLWEEEKAFIFDDVQDPERYYFDPVYWAYYHEPVQITTGTAPNLFSPDADVTRGQMVTFLWRLAGEPEASKPAAFADVEDNKYYTDAIAWASENGITTGYAGTNKFGPNDKCTREQIVTFLWRYAGEPEPSETATFTDTKAGAYYLKALSWASEEGITKGLNDGTGRFGVGQSCTRAMCVTFLYRYAEQ